MELIALALMHPEDDACTSRRFGKGRLCKMELLRKLGIRQQDGE